MKRAIPRLSLTSLLMATGLALSGLTLIGCDSVAIADGTDTPNKSYASVNGSVHVGANSTIRDIDNVNGSVSVESGAQTGDINSVNGSVQIGDGALVGSLDAVNGSITIGRDVRIENDLGTVNGSLTVASGTRIGGTVSSVNGSLSLSAVNIGGDIENFNGGIALLDGCVVEGDIRVKKKGFSIGKGHKPKIVIGANTEIRGVMTFERPVKLFVHESATVGEIRGAEAKRYSGNSPG